MAIDEGFPQVLAAAQVGAEWAWQRLYASIATGVRGYVAAQGIHDPDDLTGEVLLHLVRGIHRFEGDEAAFRSWVFLIAHHRVIDERRRNRRKDDVIRRLPLDDTTGRVDADVLDRLWREDWDERLDQLSDDQRAVLLLRVVAGLSAEDVARIVGKTPGAVRVMQHRAVLRLRELCAGEVTR